MAEDQQLDLVTIITQHKDEKKVLDAALSAGAPGATYFYGRGTGVRQKLGLLGGLIEADKIVFMLAVPPEKTSGVVQAVTKAAALDKPGNGFIFVQKVHQVVGLS